MKFEETVSTTGESTTNETRYESRASDLRGTSSRSGKRDAALKDQQSTGRKRAARMYPLDREAECEWKGKKNCGGGNFPVMGCLNGKQEARHHGPDKSVTNNEEGNVHRICHSCHYRWHRANDPTYDWNFSGYPPHRPTNLEGSDISEAMKLEIDYRSNKKRRIKD